MSNPTDRIGKGLPFEHMVEDQFQRPRNQNLKHHASADEHQDDRNGAAMGLAITPEVQSANRHDASLSDVSANCSE